ncbi:MAG: hypothetical protein M1816_006640 [Peltula sp. TS41687]|nr:MAG: hypothetical protein M1816_006640 [Peltula sp. TS41687]
MNRLSQQGRSPSPGHEDALRGYAYRTIHPDRATSQSHDIDEEVDSYHNPTATGSPPSIRRKDLPKKPAAIAETTDLVQSPPNGHEIPTLPAQWGIYWRTPSTMAALFVCGIAFALGHHLYYDRLDGQQNINGDSQEWAIRIGTALSFLAKASLCAAAAMAYKQYSWLRMRNRPITIGGIDSIQGALTDFSALMNGDMLIQSKMTTLLAILIWLIPLSAIVPPAALTVVSVVQHEILERRVPEINWPHLPTQSGGFGYWSNAGQDLFRLTTTTAYGMAALPMTPQYTNYSYTLDFFAPALTCGSIRPGTQTAFNEVLGGYWEAVPTKIHAYEAQFIEKWNLRHPNLTVSDPHLFDNELWIRTPNKNITCQTWNVSYTAQIDFQNGLQTIVILQQKDLERFVPKSETYQVAFGEDPPEAFGYRSWLETIRSLLEGSLTAGGAQMQANITKTKIVQTGLMGCPEMKPALVLFQAGDEPAPSVHDYYCRNGTLEKAIEDLSRNVTFSLFGYANGLLPSNETSPRPITKAFRANIYAYSGKILLASYGAGVFLTLLILVLGVHAMITNGAVHNSDFSGIMCATRNPDFDRIARGWCLAAEPVGKEVKRVKVQFGVVLGENGGNGYYSHKADGDGLEPVVEHAAFGLEGTVRKVQKGEKLS